MKINDVIKEVDLSKRAIKYYEAEGLLKVQRNHNGYRDYSKENIETLKEISIYRKLGISIQDIKDIQKNKNDAILTDILKKMEMELTEKSYEVNALRNYIQTRNVEDIYDQIDYQTIANAIQDAIPGFIGFYFINHFLPYLQIKIETKEQQEAYDKIVEYWDNSEIKLPLNYKITGYLLYKFMPKPTMKDMIKKMDQTILEYTQITPEKYEKLKKQVLNGVKVKNNFLYKHSIAGITQRRFMKELQDKGYNDIFIPNMIKLSPKYKEYHDALQSVNKKICDELGLYYDSNFQLVMKR